MMVIGQWFYLFFISLIIPFLCISHLTIGDAIAISITSHRLDLMWSRTGIMGSTRSEWFIEYNCRWFATVIYGFRVGWNWWSMDRDGSMDEVTTDDLLHTDDQMGRDCNTKNFVQTTNTTSKYVTIRTTLSTQQITSQPALTMRCVCTVSPIGHIAYLTITSRIDRSLEISNEWKCNGNRHRDGCKKCCCMPLRSGYIYYCNWTR